MKSIEELTKIITGQKEFLRNVFHVKAIGLFGSYARGDATEKSDLDIIVEFDAPIGFAFVDLALHLEKTLGMRVDVVSKNAIKPRMMRSIEQELIHV